jgi:hypothetical protein
MKSGKEQTTKQRAAGPEKYQDRPTHTELKTLKEDNVINTEEQQQSCIIINGSHTTSTGPTSTLTINFLSRMPWPRLIPASEAPSHTWSL